MASAEGLKTFLFMPKRTSAERNSGCMFGSDKAGAREHLLDVGLMRQVGGGLAEDDVVEREALTQCVHHGKFVEQPFVMTKGM